MDSKRTPAPDELQFDTAEVAEANASPLTCHVCQRRLFKVYFEVSGHPACETRRRLSGPPGSPLRPSSRRRPGRRNRLPRPWR